MASVPYSLVDSSIPEFSTTRNWFVNEECFYSGIPIICTANSTGAFNWNNWRPLCATAAQWKRVWTTATAYVGSDIVTPNSSSTELYLCGVGHTSTGANFNTVALTKGGAHVSQWFPIGNPLSSPGSNSQFIGSTATVAGRRGTVPGPSAGGEEQYLNATGSWATLLVAAGSAAIGTIRYSGLAATASNFNSSTSINPSGTGRLNYEGYLFATHLYVNSRLNGISVLRLSTVDTSIANVFDEIVLDRNAVNLNRNTVVTGNLSPEAGNTRNVGSTTAIWLGSYVQNQYVYAESFYNGNSSLGIKWNNGPTGALQAHIHRWGANGSALYFTNAGGANTTGMYLNVNATAWSSSSDRRVKTNIRPMGPALSKILALNPVVFDRFGTKVLDRDTDGDGVNDLGITDQIVSINEPGFIAQEAHAALNDPLVVTQPEDENEAIWGMSKEMLIPYLVKSIQELHEKIADLKTEVASLK
jgi:Chaperone of endosialidase